MSGRGQIVVTELGDMPTQIVQLVWDCVWCDALLRSEATEFSASYAALWRSRLAHVRVYHLSTVKQP